MCFIKNHQNRTKNVLFTIGLDYSGNRLLVFYNRSTIKILCSLTDPRRLVHPNAFVVHYGRRILQDRGK